MFKSVFGLNFDIRYNIRYAAIKIPNPIIGATINTSAEVEDVDSKYVESNSAYKMQIGTDGSSRLSRLFSFLLKKK